MKGSPSDYCDMIGRNRYGASYGVSSTEGSLQMIPSRSRQKKILIIKHRYSKPLYYFFLQVYCILNCCVLLAFMDNSDPQRSLGFSLYQCMALQYHPSFLVCTIKVLQILVIKHQYRLQVICYLVVCIVVSQVWPSRTTAACHFKR